MRFVSRLDTTDPLYLYMDSNGDVSVITNGEDSGCDWLFNSKEKTLYNRGTGKYLAMLPQDAHNNFPLTGVDHGSISSAATWYLWIFGNEDGYIINSSENNTKLCIPSKGETSPNPVVANYSWWGGPNQTWQLC